MKRCLLTLAAVTVIVTPALAQEKDGKWRGSLESSLTFVNSSRSSQSFLFVGNAKSVREMDRFFVDGYYNFAKQTDNMGVFQTSTDQWSLGGRYERDFGFKSFYYFNGRVERDGVNLLDLRTFAGAGIGYTVYERDASTWRVSGGGTYVNEEYRNDTDSFIGFEFRSDYDQALSERLNLVHGFTIIPRFDDLDDYYFSSNLGLSYKLNESLSAGLRYIVNFDNTPAAGSQKQSTTYAFVLGYKF